MSKAEEVIEAIESMPIEQSQEIYTFVQNYLEERKPKVIRNLIVESQDLLERLADNLELLSAMTKPAE